MYAESQNDGSSTANNVYGVYSIVDQNSSGAMDTVDAYYGVVDVAGGSTVTTSRGLRINLINAGTIDTNYGIYINDVVEGTMTNAYAFWTNEGDVVLDGDGDGVAGGTNAGSDLFFGEGQDAAIWYDGTDLNVNPQIAGSGSTNFTAGDVGIGNSAPSEKLEVTGNVKATGFIQTSDRRLKDNIETIVDPRLLLGLRGVTFDWKDDDRADYGFIAQEVEEIYPELVSTDPNSGEKAVNYANITPILLELVKDQQQQIDTLTERLNALEVSN